MEADLVVLGIGMKTHPDLAETAGLVVENGVLVNERLETSAPDVVTAGDVACWTDQQSGKRIRVERWMVAERMGWTAALNILGRRKPSGTVPIF